MKREIHLKKVITPTKFSDLVIKHIQLKKIENLKLLINIYNPRKPLTNYENIIHHPKLKDSLFVFLSNNYNSGYAGGIGGGTASIGAYEGTFGLITGYYTERGSPFSFNDLKDKNKFFLYINSEQKKYMTTPKEAIDYLIENIYTLVKENKYKSIIIPGAYNDDEGFTIGTGIFNTHISVRQYIYDKLRSFSESDELLDVNNLD
jgi:hypothetical protein